MHVQCVPKKGYPLKSSATVASPARYCEGDIFIYLCSEQLTSFKIDLISKEINCAEQEYMNMSPSLIELATPLKRYCLIFEFECFPRGFPNDPVIIERYSGAFLCMHRWSRISEVDKTVNWLGA